MLFSWGQEDPATIELSVSMLSMEASQLELLLMLVQKQALTLYK
jgi:hypothetical protein